MSIQTAKEAPDAIIFKVANTSHGYDLMESDIDDDSSPFEIMQVPNHIFEKRSCDEKDVIRVL